MLHSAHPSDYHQPLEKRLILLVVRGSSVEAPELSRNVAAHAGHVCSVNTGATQETQKESKQLPWVAKCEKG